MSITFYMKEQSVISAEHTQKLENGKPIVKHKINNGGHEHE